MTACWAVHLPRSNRTILAGTAEPNSIPICRCIVAARVCVSIIIPRIMVVLSHFELSRLRTCRNGFGSTQGHGRWRKGVCRRWEFGGGDLLVVGIGVCRNLHRGHYDEFLCG